MSRAKWLLCVLGSVVAWWLVVSAREPDVLDRMKG